MGAYAVTASRASRRRGQGLLSRSIGSVQACLFPFLSLRPTPETVTGNELRLITSIAIWSEFSNLPVRVCTAPSASWADSGVTLRRTRREFSSTYVFTMPRAAPIVPSAKDVICPRFIRQYQLEINLCSSAPSPPETAPPRPTPLQSAATGCTSQYDPCARLSLS